MTLTRMTVRIPGEPFMITGFGRRLPMVSFAPSLGGLRDVSVGARAYSWRPCRRLGTVSYLLRLTRLLHLFLGLLTARSPWVVSGR